MAKIRQAIDEFRPDTRLVDERGATCERLRKSDFYQSQTGVTTVRQGTIDRAVKAGILGTYQGLAAEKLYLHWYRAGMAGTIGSSDLLRIFSSSFAFGMTAAERGEFHYQRLKSALTAVRNGWNGAGHNGNDAVKLVQMVACEDQTFENAGQRIFWGMGINKARENAIMIVRGALNILAKEWGIN